MAKLKVGLIGCGLALGQSVNLRFLTCMPDVEVIALAPEPNAMDICVRRASSGLEAEYSEVAFDDYAHHF